MRAYWLDIYSVCLVATGIETVASSILADAQRRARRIPRKKIKKKKMETKVLKFYEFSIEKLIELSNLKRKEGNKTIQFLAQKLDGEYEVMFINYRYEIVSYALDDYGTISGEFIKKFSIL